MVENNLKKFKWTQEMSVGEPIVDKQHSTLLEQINKLIDALSKGWELPATREVIDFLGKYTLEHFTYEEKYMAENNYPGLPEHKKIHENFVKFYGSFKADFSAEYASSKTPTVVLKKYLAKAHKFLGDWLVEHIMGEDHKFCEFITPEICKAGVIPKDTGQKPGEIEFEKYSEELKWTPEISVGDSTIDEQHKKILLQIAKLETALVENNSIDVLEKSIMFLDDYIKEHLTYEEKYMEDNSYPGLPEHKKIHKDFIKFYEDFEKDFRNNLSKIRRTESLAKNYIKKIHKFLGYWWLAHIKTVDHEYCKFISKGNCPMTKAEKMLKSKEISSDEDDNVKYFLKTPPLKEKLIKTEEKPLGESRKELDSKIRELDARRKELEEVKVKEQGLIAEKEKVGRELAEEKAKEQELVAEKEKKDKELAEERGKERELIAEKEKVGRELTEEKAKEQELVDEKERLAYEYEENLKVKIQEALEKQHQDLEAHLKKQFDYREKGLTQKIEDEGVRFELLEKELRKAHSKEQSSFLQMQEGLQEKLESQKELELGKLELKKIKKEFDLKSIELAEMESNFQIAKDKAENDMELKRRELISRFDFFKDEERAEFEKEREKITQRIRDHVSSEFHDKLEEAEEVLRAKFANESSEKVEKLRALMDKERGALELKEQELVEKDNQKQISLDQVRAELDERNLALMRAEKLSQKQIERLKGEIEKSSSLLNEREYQFKNEKAALGQREKRLIEEDNRKQFSLDNLKRELDEKNLALQRIGKSSKEQAERLRGEIGNLSTVLNEKEAVFRNEKEVLGQREKRLIEKDNQKQVSLDQVRAELDEKNLVLQRVGKLKKEQSERLKGEINNLSSTLKDKEIEIKNERNALKQEEQKLIVEHNKEQVVLKKTKEELESKILIFGMAEKLNENEVEKLRDELKNKNLELDEKAKEIEIGRIEKQKDLEINRKDLEIKFANFREAENKRFNESMIKIRKKIFEKAHETLGKKFSMDLRMREEGLRREMEGKIKKLKKELKAQSDKEVKKGVNEKIELLENDLRNHIAELERQKSS